MVRGRLVNGLESLYQQLILEEAKARRGEGPLPDAQASHFERNPSCGDEITMRVRLSEDGERIEALAWEGDGCSISMASASVLCGLAEGAGVAQTRERIDAFRTMLRTRTGEAPDEELLEDAVAFQGVAKFVMRVKCAMLAWVALEAAIAEAGA